MNKLNSIALANTVAVIDLILHPLFHLWVYFSPNSYEWIMNLFVAGLQLNVTSFDLSLPYIFLGTAVEASLFWLLAYGIASIYNQLIKNNQ